MGTYNEYLKGILEKIIESHAILSDLDDKPGDVEVIKTQLLKIRGFLQVIANKMDGDRYPSLNIKNLQKKARSYLESYYFEKEIDNVSMIYADDPGRLKNLRLVILESLDDKKMMEDITEMARGI